MQHFAQHGQENYLKALYKLELRGGTKVTNSALARALELNPATVLEGVRKLAAKGLAENRPDKSIALTEEGRAKALSIVRRHRLWEVFLVDKLGYKWNEVHDIAEQLEHVGSEDLIRRLEVFLGHPAVDPHGDPIPAENGRVQATNSLPLSQAPHHESLTIVALGDTSDPFLGYLDKLSLGIGDSIHIEDIENFDGSVTLLHQGTKKRISREAADNLRVSA